MLLLEFLLTALSEHTLTGSVCLFYVFLWVKLANCHESNAFVQALLHLEEVFFYWIHLG
jgi:hypothetical protein